MTILRKVSPRLCSRAALLLSSRTFSTACHGSRPWCILPLTLERTLKGTARIRRNSGAAHSASSHLENPSSAGYSTELPETEDAEPLAERLQDVSGPWRGSSVLAAIKPPSQLDPGLYIVATPIGNLEDITLRALRVLRDADCILAEDKRHSRKLLAHFGIATQLYSFHEHNEHAKEPQVLERLAHGASVALISDAGMPAVSDPGAKLIAAAVHARHTVIPVPGPSAVLASLVASGLPTDSFQFVGFLPAKTTQRQKRLQQLAEVQATLILYAPPHSAAAILDDMAAALGESRRCVVAREMTKVHEEFHRGTLAEVASEMHSRGCKGEVTVVVEGASGTEAAAPSEAQIEAQLRELMSDGVPPSHAAKLAAKHLGLARSAVYETAMRIKGEGEG